MDRLSPQSCLKCRILQPTLPPPPPPPRTTPPMTHRWDSLRVRPGRLSDNSSSTEVSQAMFKLYLSSLLMTKLSSSWKATLDKWWDHTDIIRAHVKWRKMTVTDPPPTHIQDHPPDHPSPQLLSRVVQYSDFSTERTRSWLILRARYLKLHAQLTCSTIYSHSKISL